MTAVRRWVRRGSILVEVFGPVSPIGLCPGCDGDRDDARLRFCPACRRAGSAVLIDQAMAVRA